MRQFLFKAAVLAVVLLPWQAMVWADETTVQSGGELPAVTVYRSPSCGCCHDWVEHLQANGFTVEDIVTDEVQQQKEALGVPGMLRSCHTARVGDYVIEGHVPADDLRTLLLQRPDIAGLAVPGMPIGSPGMEMGARQDAYHVVAFDEDGKMASFNHYPGN